MSGSYDESAAAAEETTDSFWEVSLCQTLSPRCPGLLSPPHTVPLPPEASPALRSPLQWLGGVLVGLQEVLSCQHLQSEGAIRRWP